MATARAGAAATILGTAGIALGIATGSPAFAIASLLIAETGIAAAILAAIRSLGR